MKQAETGIRKNVRKRSQKKNNAFNTKAIFIPLISYQS